VDIVKVCATMLQRCLSSVSRFELARRIFGRMFASIIARDASSARNISAASRCQVQMKNRPPRRSPNFGKLPWKKFC
jgi:hypothetical protein